MHGVANILVDGVPRWDSSTIAHILRKLRPDIDWQDQRLRKAGSDRQSWPPVRRMVSGWLDYDRLRVWWLVVAHVSQLDSLPTVYGVEGLRGFEGVGIDRVCRVGLRVRRYSGINVPRNSLLYSNSIG